jgi:hypothetical protein
MVGKIIEKVYKYNIPEPSELFEMFKEKLSETTLPDSWEASEPWTTTILDVFNEIGRSLGFTPRKEYLRLDQTWEIRLPDISTIVLALEYENTDRVEEILDDELQKLLDVKALLKVLIFYPSVPAMMYEGEFTIPEIQEKIQSAKIKNPDERYVIINLLYIKPKFIIEVCATSLDSEGKGEDLGCFEVKYAAKN